MCSLLVLTHFEFSCDFQKNYLKHSQKSHTQGQCAVGNFIFWAAGEWVSRYFSGACEHSASSYSAQCRALPVCPLVLPGYLLSLTSVAVLGPGLFVRSAFCLPIAGLFLNSPFIPRLIMDSPYCTGYTQDILFGSVCLKFDAFYPVRVKHGN